MPFHLHFHISAAPIQMYWLGSCSLCTTLNNRTASTVWGVRYKVWLQKVRMCTKCTVVAWQCAECLAECCIKCSMSAGIKAGLLNCSNKHQNIYIIQYHYNASLVRRQSGNVYIDLKSLKLTWNLKHCNVYIHALWLINWLGFTSFRPCSVLLMPHWASSVKLVPS